MKRLLVIADEQEEPQEAFVKAIDLAKKTGAAIHVAIFCYEPMAVLVGCQPARGEEDLKAKLIRHKEQWWHQFVKDCQKGLDVSHEVIWEKNIHKWITEHSQKDSYDLIVKTGHRSETAFYTPTDWQLFRDSLVPIYIVTKKRRKSKKIILVALDVLAKSSEKQQLNKKLIEHAFRLSVLADAVLHCAYVVKIPTLLKDLDLIDSDRYVQKVESDVQANFSSLVQDYDVPPDCIHFERGEPWGVLANLAKKLHVQCVVVGSMGRKGITGKLIGNTAEKIIHVVKTDLLVISPEV